MPGVAEFDLAGLDAPSVAPGDFDLPAPVEAPSDLDLPQPVVAPQADSQPLDLPTPVVDLDLPTPVQPQQAPQAAPAYPGSPMASEGLDLPAPVDLDLPTPVDLDLPTPVATDLLQPANMEVQPAHTELQPSAMDVEPARTGLQPVEVDLLEPAHTDLQPADLSVEPSPGQGLAPVGAKPSATAGDVNPATAAAAAAAAVGTGEAIPAPTRTPSPANKINPVRAPSRGLMIAAGGLLVVGLGGAGVLYSGILDPVEDPQPAALSGKKPPKKVDPGAPAIDRSAAVLAKLGSDTPEAYREAIALAEQAGDAAGAAEAAILLHFRYGPDIETATKGASQIQPFSAQKDAFVQRVLGLAAISAGQHDKAEAALVGDDPRTRLYRGWLRIAQDKHADALTEALAVLAANASDQGALCLKLAALAKTDPAKAMADAKTAFEAYASHPGVVREYAKIMADNGYIALARAATSKMAVPTGAAEAYGATVKALQGDVAAASGHATKAAALFQEALALDPKNLDISIKRARALAAASKLVDAEALAVDIANEHPDAPAAHLLKVEIAIASGETERAVDTLTKLQKALPKDPRIPHHLAEVHALKLEVEEAQKLFKTARERDPAFVPASIEEAKLLAKIKELDSAIKRIDEAKTAADTDGRKADAAALLSAKGSIQLGANQRAKAIASFTATLEVEPGHNEAQLQRGLARIAAGQAAEGEADLAAVFERTGGFPGLARPLGMIYLRDNRIEDLEALIGDDLDGANTRQELQMLGARMLLLQDKSDEAKVLIDAGLSLNPSDWEGHMLRSEVLIREEKFPEAMTSVDKARPLTPQAELYLQRGRVYEFNGKYKEARPLYYKAAELDPSMHEARFLYGRALQADGQYAGAIEQLKMVVEAETAKGAKWYPEAWQYLGLSQAKADKRPDALKSLKQATTLDDNLGMAWAGLGSLYELDNNHGPAITALTKAIKVGVDTDPWYVNALMELGRAQQKSGKTSAAKATYKKFLDLAPAEHSGRPEARRVAGI